jgi:hypothetical protein
MKTSRFGRSWRLAKDSWAILKADRSLLAFPVVGSIAAVIGLLIVLGPGIGIAAAVDSPYVAIPFALVALYVTAYITIYCGVGLAAATAQVMDGQNATLRSGLNAASQHRGAIAKWALVQATVGLILNVLQSMAESDNGIFKIIGLIATALLSFAWTLASFFVIPLLAFEDLGPGDALKRSASMIKQHWGEGVIGSAAIGGIVFLVGFLPAVLLIVLGVAAGGVVAGVLIGIAVILLVIAAIVGNTLNQVFRVALYRFVTGQGDTRGFDRGDLEQAFRPKRRGRRSAATA